MNCHASASVKSEIHASSDLIRETDLLTQFTSDDHDKLNEMQKLKICGGDLNTGQSPPHPPSKKVAIPDRA